MWVLYIHSVTYGMSCQYHLPDLMSLQEQGSYVGVLGSDQLYRASTILPRVCSLVLQGSSIVES